MTVPSTERWTRAAPDWASALWRADWWPGQRALAKFVRHKQTEWVRAGRVIHWGPVSASCTVSLPDQPGRDIVQLALTGPQWMTRPARTHSVCVWRTNFASAR